MTGVCAGGCTALWRASWQHPPTLGTHLPFDLTVLSPGMYSIDVLWCGENDAWARSFIAALFVVVEVHPQGTGLTTCTFAHGILCGCENQR